MARRLRFSFLLPAILACSILSRAQPATSPLVPPARTDSTAPITVGHSVFPLYGPWKFHIGDSPTDPHTGNPLWAESGFDDANWETVDLTPKAGIVDPYNGDPRYVVGWTAKEHSGYMGWAWYRITVPVVVAQNERLALAGPFQMDDGYQVYANDKLLGSFGEFGSSQASPVVYWTHPVEFVLPQPAARNLRGAATTQTFQSFAFRVWMGSVALSYVPNAGGFHYAPLLGEEGAIAAQVQMEWVEVTRESAFPPFEAALLFLLSIVVGSLILFDTSDSVYSWVAGVLLLTTFIEVIFTLEHFTQWISSSTFFLLVGPVCAPLLLGGWMVVWIVWFHLRRSRAFYGGLAGLTLCYSVSAAIGGGSIDVPIPHALGAACQTASVVIRALFGLLLLAILRAGIRKQGKEGWLVLPAVTALFFAQFAREMILLHMPVLWHPLGFTIFIDDAANMLLAAAISLLLLRRLLLSVRRQRQMALDVKQAQEVQQVILPEARLGLPGLVVESEYRPALEVGGDFFQIIPNKDDGSLLIVAGDVTGKGLKAGMLVALLVGAIRSTTDWSSDPLVVLRALNERLLGRGDAQATCLGLRIAANGEATLANAGHMAPYLNGEPLAMEGALPLGMIEGAEFSVMRFELKEADKLVLMSDGIAEATDADGHLFGFDRVHELLRTATTAAEVASAAQRFGQEDDISVIAVTRTALGPAAA